MERSETLYSDPAIIEAAARVLESLDDDSCGLDDCADWYQDKLRQQAEAILAAVTPLIRAAALEEAAVVAEDEDGWPRTTAEIAAAIRAIKEQP